MNYRITTITSSVKLVQLTYFSLAEMSYRISFSVVKAIKCSLFCITQYRSCIIFDCIGKTEQNFETYCTVRIFSVENLSML